MTEERKESVLIDSEMVAGYLRRHPEFFVDHDELIPDLRIPHLPGEAVSLVERQVKLLLVYNHLCRKKKSENLRMRLSVLINRMVFINLII